MKTSRAFAAGLLALSAVALAACSDVAQAGSLPSAPGAEVPGSSSATAHPAESPEAKTTEAPASSGGGSTPFTLPNVPPDELAAIEAEIRRNVDGQKVKSTLESIQIVSYSAHQRAAAQIIATRGGERVGVAMSLAVEDNEWLVVAAKSFPI